tara:strand:+ start:718 stop:960 length:243 start_codon:yes stop_codon:yes gene_type:complete
MNTDSDLERIIDRLKIASETHPNICNLWANYLFLKRTAYDNAITQAVNMLDTLNDSEDIDHNTLIALFTISRLAQRPSNR